jgi:hypothetical protein
MFPLGRFNWLQKHIAFTSTLGVQTIGTADFLIAQERVRRDAFSVIN